MDSIEITNTQEEKIKKLTGDINTLIDSLKLGISAYCTANEAGYQAFYKDRDFKVRFLQALIDERNFQIKMTSGSPL